MPTQGGGTEIFMLYLLLADGFEEAEAICPLDVLRRAEIEVKTVGITGKTVTGAHGIEIKADLGADDIGSTVPDGIILPGGMPGTLNLQKSPTAKRLLSECFAAGKLIAAICAAPMIPGELGMLHGVRSTCFPGFEENLIGAVLTDDSVVCDKNFITAKGAGVALEFGAAIVDRFVKPDPARGSRGSRILSQMQLR